MASLPGVVKLVGTTHLHVSKLKINGIDPTHVTYVVRELWDPEGVTYEVEHVPTGTTVNVWASGRTVDEAVKECVAKVAEV